MSTFDRAALDLVGSLTDAEFADFIRQARQPQTQNPTGRTPMNTTAARRELVNLTAEARKIRDDLTAQVEAIRKDRDISDELRRTRITEVRDAAAQTLISIKRRLDSAVAIVTGYMPPAPADAALSRAAVRAAQMLDAGMALQEVVRVAVQSGDAAMIAATREVAPARIAVDVDRNGGRLYGASAAQALADFTKAAEVGAALTLTGPDRTLATDAALGKAQAELAKLELAAAQLEAMGRSTGTSMAHSVDMAYARQDLEALTIRLAA